jgi:hypothetical protein
LISSFDKLPNVTFPMSVNIWRMWRNNDQIVQQTEDSYFEIFYTKHDLYILIRTEQLLLFHYIIICKVCYNHKKQSRNYINFCECHVQFWPSLGVNSHHVVWDTGITILKGSTTLSEHIIYPKKVRNFFISMNNPVVSFTFLLMKKVLSEDKKNLRVLLHIQYDCDLLGHLNPSINKTASLFQLKIDKILQSLYQSSTAILYCLIKHSGNCYASLKMPLCHVHFLLS